MSKIKVFKIGEGDWYAGNSLDDCVQQMMKDTGLTREECLQDDYQEIPENKWTDINFYDEDERSKKETIREIIDQIIEENRSFPCLIASTEY